MWPRGSLLGDSFGRQNVCVGRGLKLLMGSCLGRHAGRLGADEYKYCRTLAELMVTDPVSWE